MKFNAALEIIKIRFKERMNGRLPEAVEKMIEKQYVQWENIAGDFQVNTLEDDIEVITNFIESL